MAEYEPQICLDLSIFIWHTAAHFIRNLFRSRSLSISAGNCFTFDTGGQLTAREWKVLRNNRHRLIHHNDISKQRYNKLCLCTQRLIRGRKIKINFRSRYLLIIDWNVLFELEIINYADCILKWRPNHSVTGDKLVSAAEGSIMTTSV